MKMNISSVGQASRLSFHSWRRHFPYFQLVGDSRDGCPTGYYFIGKLWQDENFDRAIRDEEEFLEKINYIANNPIKVNLANKYEEYKWLYIKGWINDYS